MEKRDGVVVKKYGDESKLSDGGKDGREKNKIKEEGSGRKESDGRGNKKVWEKKEKQRKKVWGER